MPQSILTGCGGLRKEVGHAHAAACALVFVVSMMSLFQLVSVLCWFELESSFFRTIARACSGNLVGSSIHATHGHVPG